MIPSRDKKTLDEYLSRAMESAKHIGVAGWAADMRALDVVEYAEKAELIMYRPTEKIDAEAYRSAMKGVLILAEQRAMAYAVKEDPQSALRHDAERAMQYIGRYADQAGYDLWR